MSEPPAPAVTMPARGPALLRDLRRGDVLALTLNNMVGAGIFTMPVALAAGAGGLSLTVLLVTAMLVAMMALCLVEVASRFDTTGGPMIYASAAFGPTTGFIVGWLMFLSRLSAFGAILVVMLDYGAGIWAPLAATTIRSVTITAVVAALTVINLLGIARCARMSHVLVFLKLVPLVFVAAAGVWIAPRVSAPPLPASLNGIGGAVLIAFFAFMGFETGAVLAGEVRNPRRDLPAGILGAIGGVAVLYALVMVACLRAVGDLAHATRPIADVAGTMLGPNGILAVSAIAVVSCVGTLTVVMITTPRILYALAIDGDMPSMLAMVHPLRRTPVAAILASATIIWLLTVSGGFIYLATFSAMARILMYGSTCASLIVLRRRDGAAPVPIPWGPAFAVAALTMSLAAILATTGTEIRDMSIAIGLGWLVRTLVKRRTPVFAPQTEGLARSDGSDR